MNTLSTQMTNCPSLAELTAFTKTADPAIEGHVSSCRRCRALLRLLGERETTGESDLALPELPELPHASVPSRESPSGEITIGEVCIIDANSGGGTLLVGVVVAEGDTTPETLRFTPVSTETMNASDWDLLLAPEDSPLGYQAMVEVWNEGTILNEQVVERLGVLVVDGQHRLNAMYGALLADAVPPADVPRGVPVLSDTDPRAIFQEDEAERARPFWQPAARAFAEAPAAVATLGALMSRWLEQQGYEPADYAKEIGWSKQDIVFIVSDQFKPGTFNSERLVEAFRRTDIASSEIEAGLWGTIRPEHFASGAAIVEERAYRRTAGRQGLERTEWSSRGATVALSPKEQERRRKQYINDVLQGLEEKRGF